MIMIMIFLMGAFTEKGRIQEYIFALDAKWYSWFTCHVNGTRHSYELQRSDGGPKYEIWLWVIKSYVELHLRLLESYQVRRLLDIHNNFRVMMNKCEHQRDVKIGLSQRLFLKNSKGWLQYVAMLESMGLSLWLIQIVINTVTSSNAGFEEVTVLITIWINRSEYPIDSSIATYCSQPFEFVRNIL